MICRAASCAAARTAGPMLGTVEEPAEIDAYGPRAESPSTTSTRSSGRPSSSAAICAIAVRVPVPMSCMAVITVARPSEPTRTQAYEAGRAERGHRRGVQLRPVLDGAHVLAGVEHLHRPRRRREPAPPADRVHEL